MLSKNQLVTLEITGISHEGNGIGRHEGMVVFVPQTCVGDVAQVKILKVLSHHAFGRLEGLVKASDRRIDPVCPVYSRCGGCSLRHMTYPEELRQKSQWVADNLSRIGGVHPEMGPAIPSPQEQRYRNKAQYPVRLIDGQVRTGFFAPRSHSLIPVDDCMLQPECFAELAKVLCSFMEEKGILPYDELSHQGLVRHLYLRIAPTTGEVMACIVINGSSLPEWELLLERLCNDCPQLSTLVLDCNTKNTNVILSGKQKILFGSGRIEDTLQGVQVRLSPSSFYQVNHPAAELLYKQALEYADPSPKHLLLDLYCGAGTIGLSMAHRVREVIGVEVVEAAIDDAKENARRNNISNARFILADAEQAVKKLAEEGISPDIVVLDPPRKGASPTTLNSICEMSPQKIVYISCNSATLARDCAGLSEMGYSAVKCTPVDLFPRTAHVEAVCLLQR